VSETVSFLHVLFGGSGLFKARSVMLLMHKWQA